MNASAAMTAYKTDPILCDRVSTQNDVYEFPFVDVCLAEGFGCSSSVVSNCVGSVDFYGATASYWGEEGVLDVEGKLSKVRA